MEKDETRRRRPTSLATVDEAIEEYRNGRSVIIVDDEDRENEGDLTIPAQFATPDAINFMARNGRGLICVPMTGERLDELKLPMIADNNSHFGTPFTIPVEAREGVTTGISAHDRSRTIQVLIDPACGPLDLVRPGHTFPLRAREGGVLVRAGQTEASVDLCKLAGLYPAAVVCEIMKSDGTMARLPDLKRFAARHNLKILTVKELITYRLHREKLVERVTETVIPIEGLGSFKLYAYRSLIDPDEHIALVMGDVDPDEPTLVRVHSQCVTGDVFGSMRCDCGEQMQMALKMIADAGNGVFVYMRQEGRGIGLHNKLRAYALQDNGMDTVEANEALGFPADKRGYGIGMQILVDIGARKLRLLTNNPKKRSGLEGYGLEVIERVPIQTVPNAHNIRYLETKRSKLGHLLVEAGGD
ncbi:MAG: bifunctional 3,4-dihydroxy-2-butanone-4-phosphate synthase/GTP cyclohydrolase II [Dehalococcoidia bacterium]